MKKFSIFVMSLLCMLLFQGETIAQSTFKASTALVDITPSNNGFPRMFLGGFARDITGAASWGTLPNQPLLTARALSIQDCTDNIKVIVTADILGFTHNLRQQILAEALQRYNLSSQNLLLAASHTHSGPVLTGSLDPAVTYTGLSSDGLADSDDLRIIDNYTNWLKDAIVNLVGTAINGLSTAPPATLSYGVGTANICSNERLLTDSITDKDNDVPVLAVKSANDNSLLAVVFGYACHPLSFGLGGIGNGRNYYHPDYPGVATTQLEQSNGGMAFFIQGTAGDIDDRWDDVGVKGLDLAVREGQLLVSAVEGILTGNGLQPVTGPILTQSQEISLPLNMDQNDTGHQNLRATYVSVRDWPGLNVTYVRHANQMIDQIDRGILPDAEPLPVQVWHFGAMTPSSLVLAALGGEPVSHYSLFLKDQFRSLLGNKLWVAGYSNEVPGYIPSNAVWDLPMQGASSYEAGWICGTNFCTPLISSFGTSQMWYGWHAPLKRGDIDNGGTVKGMEELVKEQTTSMIEYLPAVHPGGSDNNCNGVDEDCNELIDDGYVATPTTCGQGVCVSTGQNICQNGQVVNTCKEGSITGYDDNCNGIDENCNGLADENYEPIQSSCGIGACESTGQLICENGAIKNTCAPGEPTTETCDNIDNNCNGVVDENYVFGGFQQPINSDGSSIFNLGRTIPVKIILTNCSGQSISTAVVTIAVNKISNVVLGTEVEQLIDSSGNANTGNLFRYDATAGQYIFNLSTKGYTKGTYKVYAKITDGISYSVNFSLK
jgi:hypothetical protein